MDAELAGEGGVSICLHLLVLLGPCGRVFDADAWDRHPLVQVSPFCSCSVCQAV